MVSDRPSTTLLRSLRLVVFDFDGVFTDNTVIVHQDGTESVRCWRSDGLGIARLRATGVELAVLSTEQNPVVSARCAKLRLECIQGCEEKGAALRALAARRAVPLAQVAYVGNDVNDITSLRLAGLPIAVADAHPSILPLAEYRTRARGGRGAVREICDMIAAAHEASPEC